MKLINKKKGKTMNGAIPIYRAKKIQQGLESNSKRVQFPVNEKLKDGRHRYYIKYDQKVDRSTQILY